MPAAKQKTKTKTTASTEAVASSNPLTPKPDCSYCLGTGLYGILDGTYSIACVSGPCMYCDCNGCTSYVGLTKTCKSCDAKLVIDQDKAKLAAKFKIEKKKIKKNPNFVFPGSLSPRTQKSIGILALEKAQSAFNTNLPLLIQKEDDIQQVYEEIIEDTNTYFARPCPIVPRHGFVESRVLPEKTVPSLQKIWKEVVEADPEGELLLARLIKANSSAIWVPESGYLVVGPGHDGATGGNPKSITLPTIPASTPATVLAKEESEDDCYVAKKFELGKLRDLAKIPQDAHTYIEIVNGVNPDSENTSRPNRCFAVQARSGPALTTSAADWVPEKITVGTVITPTDDLLAWEGIVNKHKGQPGVVAWKKGASLACHAAIHCITAGIPFLTTPTEKPKPGDIIAATLEKEAAVHTSKLDLQEAHLGFKLALQKDYENYWNTVPLAIGILHNTVALRTTKHWSRLYGFMVGTIFHAGALACMGEARHDSDLTRVPDGSREDTYSSFIDTPISSLLSRLHQICFAFTSDDWGGSYGGIPWAECTREVLTLYKVWEDDEEGIKLVNRVINVCHNGGPLLTKLAPIHFALESGEKLPGITLANGSSILYKLLTTKVPKKAVVMPPWKPIDCDIEVKRSYLEDGEMSTPSGGIIDLTMKFKNGKPPTTLRNVLWIGPKAKKKDVQRRFIEETLELLGTSSPTDEIVLPAKKTVVKKTKKVSKA